MAVSIKRASMWRREISNKPGTLANSLKTLSKAGVNLQTVMGYVYPGQPKKAAVEVYPISGTKAVKAAKSAGLKAEDAHCLLVEGDDKMGLCHKMTDAIADAGINLSFVVIQVFGRKYSGWFGFKSEADASRAIPIIKAANGVGSAMSKPAGKSKKITAKRKPSKVRKAAKKLGAKIIKLSSAKKRKKGATAKAAMRRTAGKRKTKKKTGKRK